MLRSPQRTLTYEQAHEQVDRWARVLIEDLGLVPGNRVLLRAPNCPVLAACWFAAAAHGQTDPAESPAEEALGQTAPAATPGEEVAEVDAVAAIESRGFMFGAPLAVRRRLERPGEERDRRRGLLVARDHVHAGRRARATARGRLARGQQGGRQDDDLLHLNLPKRCSRSLRP